MSKPEIIRKLTMELQKGIESEVQAVYLLTGVRKLMERGEVKDKYSDLKFHCDWVLHAKLSGPAAQSLLRKFDEANKRLKNEQITLKDLPEVDRISNMETLKKELSQFLSNYGLPSLTMKRQDGWNQFLYLYCNVVQDIPLVVQDSAVQEISRVVVRVDTAEQGTEILFKVTWTICEKNGKTGTIFVINSFSKEGSVYNKRGLIVL